MKELDTLFTVVALVGIVVGAALVLAISMPELAGISLVMVAWAAIPLYPLYKMGRKK